MAETMATPPIRLDRAVEQLSAEALGYAGRVELERFEEALRRHRSARSGVASSGLIEQLFDALMPRLQDTSFLRGGRCLALLREIIETLEAPDADDAGEIQRWGMLVLRDELRKQELLWQYLNDLVEP